MFKQLWQKSQTVALAGAQAVTGVASGGIIAVHSVLTDSEIKEYLGQLTLPKWFPIVLLVIAVLTYVAHGHKDDA